MAQAINIAPKDLGKLRVSVLLSCTDVFSDERKKFIYKRIKKSLDETTTYKNQDRHALKDICKLHRSFPN